jgi:hypothetical protein
VFALLRNNCLHRRLYTFSRKRSRESIRLPPFPVVYLWYSFVVWGERNPAMFIIFSPQLLAISFTSKSSIQAGPSLLRIVRRTTMCEVRAKYQYIPGCQRDLGPLLGFTPRICYSATVGEWNGLVNFVGAGDDFKASVCGCCGIDCEIGSHVFCCADVIVGWGIKVGMETVAMRGFVVDFVFEKQHILHSSQ